MIPTPETGTLYSVRYHLARRGDGRAGSGRDDHRRHHPPRDDPRRHRRRRAPRRRRATPPSSGRRVRIPFVERDVPIIADAVVDPAFGTRRGEDHARPRPRRLRDRQAPRPRDAHDPRRRRAGSRTPARAYDGLDRYDARKAIVADLAARGDLEGEQRPRDGHRALPAQRRRGGAAAQDPVVRADGPARGVGPRGDPRAARRGSSPSASRRPGSTG